MKPVLKIGAVILRASDKAVLIVQPIPKQKGEIPPYVLPRGTRQYAVVVSGETEWRDVPRDTSLSDEQLATLEPFYRGLVREIDEEAGISHSQLELCDVQELGTLDFKSRSKGNYPIHWYVVVPDKETEKSIGRTMPADALSVRWASLKEIRELDKEGKFSSGYVPVIEKALKKL